MKGSTIDGTGDQDRAHRAPAARESRAGVPEAHSLAALAKARRSGSGHPRDPGASYLVVANVLLRTRLLRNMVSRNSAVLQLDYESAYSIIPGRVQVEGLSIRGRGRTMEWFLTLDRADASISLVDLFHRSLHATRLRSSGLTIRVRLRLESEDATPDVIAALPPIAGFADPPLLDGGPAPPP